MGTVRGTGGALVEVDCRDFADASTGTKAYGITVTVKSGTRFEKESLSYVDYEEIDALVKGIEYIRKIEKSATKLDRFQADYKTKGDLTVSTFSTGKEIQGAIQSGNYSKTMAIVSLQDLDQFKEVLLKSKKLLDGIKE